MSESNLEEEPRGKCKEAKFVDDNFAKLIERVTSVMPLADELKSDCMLHGEKYDEIKAEKTSQDKMRKLFESLNSGGDEVKKAFYYLLEKHQPQLFEDLGGVRRKRKPADPESPVPYKRLKIESNVQDQPYFNNASTLAQRPAPTYNENNIVHGRGPPYNMDIFITPPAPKKEKKSPVAKVKEPSIPKKEKKPLAPKTDKKPPGPKVKKPPAPKKEKKPPVPKEKKPPVPKKEKKPPVPKEKKPSVPKEEKKPPVPKVKKPPAPKKQKKPPVPKVKKPPAPKKEKKPPVPKVKKPPAPKKVKKPPVPKVKKPPAPKKVKKPPGRK